MRSVTDWLFLFGVESLAIGFIALSVIKGSFRRHLFLNLYTLGILAGDAVREVVFRIYGLRSLEYFFAYFGSDFCIVVLKYIAILSVFEILLRESPLRTQARLAFLFFFGLTAAMSYGFISNTVFSNATLFYKRLVVEFEQNMYFASVVLAALLCLTLAHLRVKDAQLRMLICGLGVSGALQTCSFAFVNLAPKDSFKMWWTLIHYISPLATGAMFSMWSYAVAHVPALSLSPALVRSPAENAMGAGMGLAPAFVRAEARG
jgi:hypothetical protein